jgi:bifunctional DNase/RNase
MTHDLLRNLISALGGQAHRVVVTDLRENTFFATTHLAVKGEQVAIDARPSDAVALVPRSRLAGPRRGAGHRGGQDQ